MNYEKYKNARDAVWRILIDLNINKLPISAAQVCRQLGISVRVGALDGESDGRSMILGRTPFILVKENCLPERQRFTAAHELGHILLGHVGKYALVNREPSPNDNPIESEANVFASRLLAPACVLWGCNVQSADDIMALCRISRQAAEYRMERMKILYERNRFLTSPLEREVYRQFKGYIQSNPLNR